MTGKQRTGYQISSELTPSGSASKPASSGRLVPPERKNSTAARCEQTTCIDSYIIDGFHRSNLVFVKQAIPLILIPCPTDAVYTHVGQWHDAYFVYWDAGSLSAPEFCLPAATSVVAWVQPGGPVTSNFIAAIQASQAAFPNYYSGIGGPRPVTNLLHWQKRCGLGLAPTNVFPFFTNPQGTHSPVSTGIGQYSHLADLGLQVAMSKSATTQELIGVQALSVVAFRAAGVTTYKVGSVYFPPYSGVYFEDLFGGFNLPSTVTKPPNTFSSVVPATSIPDPDGSVLAAMFGPTPKTSTNFTTYSVSTASRGGVSGLFGLFSYKEDFNDLRDRRSGTRGAGDEPSSDYANFSGGSGEYNYCFIPGVS